MHFATTVQNKLSDLPATTETTNTGGEDASPASLLNGFGSEMSVILLGAALLSFAGFQFLKKVGKTMASNAGK